jgi:hypothetical protein
MRFSGRKREKIKNDVGNKWVSVRFVSANSCGNADFAKLNAYLFRNKKRTSGAKAHCKQNTCGTAEAVPLSKTGFFRSLKVCFFRFCGMAR